VVGWTLRLRIVREVSQTQLAALWNNPTFRKPKHSWLIDVAARFGGGFTVIAVGLAAIGALAWLPDTAMSIQVATAVLIIACPCALTLATPITLGTTMGCLGRYGLYLKDPSVALDLTRIDSVVFDKTGTLTTAADTTVAERDGLDDADWSRVRRLAAESVHPVSRVIARSGPAAGAIDGVREYAAEGLFGTVDGRRVALGRARFVATQSGLEIPDRDDRTFAAVDNRWGAITLATRLRGGLDHAARVIGSQHRVALSSGDHPAEAPLLRPLFGERMRFRQTPEDKLRWVRAEQAAGHHVLMVGDGLNDAGALAAADVGIAVSDDTATIVPACDAVIHGDRLARLPVFLRYARAARTVILICFAVSVLYNVLGLWLALTGRLTPLVTAILMPVSSLTIVGLSTGIMRGLARWILAPQPGAAEAQ
jgi:Cu+-exporting ATPase